jgi:hypothetical protein
MSGAGQKTNVPGAHNGPHNSRLANLLDPRVDSSKERQGGTHSSGATGTGAGVGAGTGAGYGSGQSARVTGYNDPEGTHGPHSSRLANAADPRVDSDRDNRAAGAGYGSATNTGYGGGVHHTTAPAQTGYGATTGQNATGGYSGGNGVGYSNSGAQYTTGYDDPEGTHGPHGNRLANAADPRVDSDRDHRGAPGYAGQSAPGATATTGRYGATGPAGTTGTTGTTTGQSTGASVGQKIKGVFAQGHVSPFLPGIANRFY